MGHHRAELGELYTSSVVDVVLHYCQQYDDCCFVTTRWLNGTMSQLGNATTITCKKYMMSQLYIVDVLIMILIMPTPHSSTQVFRSLLDFVPLLALPNPIPDWSARSYNICYRQSLWAFISSKLQFRHRLDDSLKHRSLADLIGGPEWDLALAKSLIIRHRKRKTGSWSFIWTGKNVLL